MEVDDGFPQYFFTSAIDMPVCTILLPQRSVSAVADAELKSKNAKMVAFVFMV